MAVVHRLATNARLGKTEVKRHHTLRAFCIREHKLISTYHPHVLCRTRNGRHKTNKGGWDYRLPSRIGTQHRKLMIEQGSNVLAPQMKRCEE
ncbi:hypothetical protein M9H77_19004 [Catharanthus roseus]|uniref:Uncharacterized protein n=1 Tax=Catharanthus roseus TaxID=4058 RepID=A0ACC0B952_CATRO|nr:hypothetical protein M9H77_19004 [Catharanthus roseus]